MTPQDDRGRGRDKTRRPKLGVHRLLLTGAHWRAPRLSPLFAGGSVIHSGSANDSNVVPDAITTCCLPSSMKVIGAAPQIGVPVEYRQRLAPVRESNAMKLPSLSPANTRPDAVLSTPAIAGDVRRNSHRRSPVVGSIARSAP